VKHYRWAGAVTLAIGALAVAAAVAQNPPLRGFSPESSQQQLRWEQIFRRLPQADRIREFSYILSRQPHAVGQPYQEENTRFLVSQFQQFGFDTHVETFWVLFPTPRERLVELIEPTHYQLKLREPPVPEDPDSSDPGQLPTYNAFSIDGDVTGQLVYVNYGLPEDYEQLEKMHIDVRGKIVLARYGRSWRGIKPKVAAEHGAIGCLIYSDPRDDGYLQGDVFPRGPYRPPDGVQRGSVADEAATWSGDALTPGWAATKDARRLSFDEARRFFTKIPTMPISYADAQPLLAALAGPVAPPEWRGALPITYHIGPGPAVVHLKVSFNWTQQPVRDVIAVLRGSTWPDQWVVQGNHYDAWVNGADDPVSGMAALLEEARALGELARQGWRPRRTIVLAAWDGEEPGLLGSTEWAEAHATELVDKAVAYINSDSSTRGFLNMGGSHTLEKFFNEVARDVDDPLTGQSLWQRLRERRLERARNDAERRAIEARADLRIEALGSGSDYGAFLDHLGIAVGNFGFGGEGGGGVYHSIYDDFYWYTHFGDPDFVYERTLAQTLGTMVLRLADADVLPFEFTDLADTIGGYVRELRELHDRSAGAPAMDFGPLEAAADHLRRAAADYADAYQKAVTSGALFRKSPAELEALNRLLYQVDRKMTTPEGLPEGRQWYRNQIYAPGLYTGYAVKTLPAVRENLEQKRWSEAAAQIPVLARVLEAISAEIEAARARL